MQWIENTFLVEYPGFLAPKESSRHSHQRILLDLCYDYQNRTKQDQKTLVHSVDQLFKHHKEIERSYLDDSMNTDHAWIEVVVASVHDNQYNMPHSFQNGRGVESVEWVSLVERPHIHSNMAAVMKKTLTMLKAYNPYNTNVTPPASPSHERREDPAPSSSTNRFEHYVAQYKSDN
eukprot:sb/3471937/